jgi:hypothetical protein
MLSYPCDKKIVKFRDMVYKTSLDILYILG